MALELVDVAVKAQADAVKCLTFKPEKVCSPAAPKATYQLQTTGGDESQLEMGKKLELPFEAFRELQAYCKSKDLLFLSTAFDYESADFLSDLPVPAFKVPSGRSQTPLRGAYREERTPADSFHWHVNSRRGSEGGGDDSRSGKSADCPLAVREHYPAQPSSVNLRAMNTLAKAFDVPVGYSDHTTGTEIASAAVALGALVLRNTLLLAVICQAPTIRPPWNQTNWPRWYVVYEMSKLHWEMGINGRSWRKRIPLL